MIKIFLDFGHGGTDPGALRNGHKEKDLTLSIGLKVADILKKHGIQIIYARTTDVAVSLVGRSNKANANNVTIVVSIHVNAATNPSANGVETFSHTGSREGAKLAKAIQDSLVASKLFDSNRGTKTANFHILRETKAPAALTELGFITNIKDIQNLKKQNEIALAVAKGILNYLGVRYIENKPGPISRKTNILGKTTATIEQMQEWAKKKGANQLFIDLAPAFYNVSNKAGVNPLVAYCQSAKETNYMRFGGVLNASFNNPCGMKTSGGGGDKDPNAHQRFKNWEEGVQAQIDHLALYAGATGYPKTGTPDPRHFPYLKGTAVTVEDLGGKWAPSSSYGTEIVRMTKEIEVTPAPTKPIDQNKTSIKINLLGNQRTIKGNLKDGTNYIQVDGKEISLRSLFEAMGFEVSWGNDMVVIK